MAAATAAGSRAPTTACVSSSTEASTTSKGAPNSKAHDELLQRCMPMLPVVGSTHRLSIPSQVMCSRESYDVYTCRDCRDAQLQHAVVLGGGMPLEDGLEALAARYYCQVCGVATTSETNLQVRYAALHVRRW